MTRGAAEGFNRQQREHPSTAMSDPNLFSVVPVVLEHDLVRLEPLALDHYEGLAEISQDPALFRYMTFDRITEPGRLRAWMEQVIAGEMARGEAVAFAIRELTGGRIAGCTSYMDIHPKDRGVEIGRTWVGTAYQRTAVNTTAKYLLLRHAFETLGANRVQIKTDERNLQSQAAIARLGAQREGILRAHKVLPDGYLRNTVMYSVTAAEWPAVKSRLESFLYA